MGKQVPGGQNQPVAGQRTTKMNFVVAQYIVLIGCFDREFTLTCGSFPLSEAKYTNLGAKKMKLYKKIHPFKAIICLFF